MKFLDVETRSKGRLRLYIVKLEKQEEWNRTERKSSQGKSIFQK